MCFLSAIVSLSLWKEACDTLSCRHEHLIWTLKKTIRIVPREPVKAMATMNIMKSACRRTNLHILGLGGCYKVLWDWNWRSEGHDCSYKDQDCFGTTFFAPAGKFHRTSMIWEYGKCATRFSWFSVQNRWFSMVSTWNSLFLFDFAHVPTGSKP